MEGITINIYIDSSFGNGIYAWNKNTDLLGEWPGKSFHDSLNGYYEESFSDNCINFIVLRNGKKITSNLSTNKPILIDKDGNIMSIYYEEEFNSSKIIKAGIGKIFELETLKK